MATQETQILDKIIVNTRRKMITLGGTALAGLAFAGATKAYAQTTAITDSDILNFALNLEYLEAQFYTLAVSGVTIDKLTTPIPVAVNGGTAGAVTLKPSFAKVPFAMATVASYAAETAIEEQKHVKFLQGALSTKAVSMPAIDLYNSFNALATAAGIGASFDPFANDANFLIGAYIFEDVGVSAYHGAAGLITDKTTILPAAVGIHAVEAYHAGLVRTTINALDAGTGTLNTLTQKISAARSTLANPAGATTTTYLNTKADDIGLTTVQVALNGTAGQYTSSTVVNCDSNSLGWARTTTQVLAITKPFFPAGLNGTIK
jgi:hypothetical protein